MNEFMVSLKTSAVQTKLEPYVPEKGDNIILLLKRFRSGRERKSYFIERRRICSV